MEGYSETLTLFLICDNMKTVRKIKTGDLVRFASGRFAVVFKSDGRLFYAIEIYKGRIYADNTPRNKYGNWFFNEELNYWE